MERDLCHNFSYQSGVVVAPHDLQRVSMSSSYMDSWNQRCRRSSQCNSTRYTNQRLCIKIQNEVSTTASEVRRISKYGELRCRRPLEFLEVVGIHDDTLARRIVQRQQDPLEVVGATTTPPWYEKCYSTNPPPLKTQLK